MASELPPVMTEVILSGPEIVLVDRVLVRVLERDGMSTEDDLVAGYDVNPLAEVHARWTQHVRDLDTGGCGLSVDGIGLRILTVSLRDVHVLTLALKSHLVDLTFESISEDDPAFDELYVQPSPA